MRARPRLAAENAVKSPCATVALPTITDTPETIDTVRTDVSTASAVIWIRRGVGALPTAYLRERIIAAVSTGVATAVTIDTARGSHTNVTAGATIVVVGLEIDALVATLSLP